MEHAVTEQYGTRSDAPVGDDPLQITGAHVSVAEERLMSVWGGGSHDAPQAPAATGHTRSGSLVDTRSAQAPVVQVGPPAVAHVPSPIAPTQYVVSVPASMTAGFVRPYPAGAYQQPWHAPTSMTQLSQSSRRDGVFALAASILLLAIVLSAAVAMEGGMDHPQPTITSPTQAQTTAVSTLLAPAQPLAAPAAAPVG